MKKVREPQEAGPAQNAEGSERSADGPLREPWVTLSDEKSRLRTAEVRRRATGGGGRDKGDVETRARGRATSTEGGMEDAIGPIQTPEGRLVLEDGVQQAERVTLSNGEGRGQTAFRPFHRAKGRTQDAGTRPTSGESTPFCAKSSAVARFRHAHSAKMSGSGARLAACHERRGPARSIRADVRRIPRSSAAATDEASASTYLTTSPAEDAGVPAIVIADPSVPSEWIAQPVIDWPAPLRE